MDSLSIPDPGPSASGRRPSSVQPHVPSSSQSSSSRRQRASHTISPTQPQESRHDDRPVYQDVYSHPAAIAFAAAHPRRTIPKFGPYLLLQTLGEGEFGKVKLGLHSQWGEEVAVKLIRRGNIETPVRMSKVEREIEVLRTLKHPNIVRLYDVIETDKYIGIILEYASGGELFDHILAHRYLREKDAAKLFSQLISGVAYIHAKKIVHRDLKLENLLLDRNRNVIITDFGFANRFEHRADDLMQTSCGSPCYAAPELVISEGLYVGSAVDIWSCGVILYAMLAGYLPFDDDPANPDGDNINLLYKYIVNTPLAFPDYISPQARDLLGIMLVPDPKKRADLPTIMAHEWLAAWRHTFTRSVEELEQAALEQHQAKRMAYQRQIRQAAAARAPEYLYDSSVDQSQMSTSSPQGPSSGRRAVASAMVLPTTHTQQQQQQPRVTSQQRNRGDFDLDDPFAPPPSVANNVPVTAQETAPKKENVRPNRHTVQIEPAAPQAIQPPPRQQPVADGNRGKPTTRERATSGAQPPSAQVVPPSINGRRPSMASQNGDHHKPLPVAPAPLPSRVQVPAPVTVSPPQESIPTPTVLVAPPTPKAPVNAPEPIVRTPTNSTTAGSARSTGSSGHKRGISIGSKPALGKLFGSDAGNPMVDRVASDGSAQSAQSSIDTRSAASHVSAMSPSSASTVSADKAKKSRRNTMNIFVEPLRRARGAGKTASTEITSSRKDEHPIQPKSAVESHPPSSYRGDLDIGQTPSRAELGMRPPSISKARMQASTSKAKGVMDWFRRNGRPGESETDEPGVLKNEADALLPAKAFTAQTPTQQTFNVREPLPTPEPTRAPSVSGRSFSSRILRTPAKTTLRVHHGAVDKKTITSLPPHDVMRQVRVVLQGMGIAVQEESEYKYRCLRPKRGKADNVAAFAIQGSAASNGVDKRGLPLPSNNSFNSAGGMLRGLLMRRQSSQVSGTQVPFEVDDSVLDAASPSSEPLSPLTSPSVYGDSTDDAGDEVRFSVEVTRIDKLENVYSLDIRRLKGNLRSYKFLYDMLRERAALGQ